MREWPTGVLRVFVQDTLFGIHGVADDIGSRPAAWSLVQCYSCSLCLLYELSSWKGAKDTYLTRNMNHMIIIIYVNSLCICVQESSCGVCVARVIAATTALPPPLLGELPQRKMRERRWRCALGRCTPSCSTRCLPSSWLAMPPWQ